MCDCLACSQKVKEAIRWERIVNVDPAPNKTDVFLANIEETYRAGLGLIKQKNLDYATDADPFKNFRSAEVAGVDVGRAILVRVLDKISRLSNLMDRDPTVVEEAVEDTALDAVNYFAILKAWWEIERLPTRHSAAAEKTS